MLRDIICWLARALGDCHEKSEVPGLKPDLPADYPVFVLPWSDVMKRLTELGLTPMTLDMPDVHMFYTDRPHWAQIMRHLIYSAEPYSKIERRDCDDYSKKASADSSFYFGLGCIQVWGDSPYGYHAYNLVFAGTKTVLIFEPNAGFEEVAGELMALDDKRGWHPRKWKP